MSNGRPTDRHLRALQAMQCHERGRPGVINLYDAEECEERGWAEAQPGGGYRLTEAGRRLLAGHGYR